MYYILSGRSTKLKKKNWGTCRFCVVKLLHYNVNNVIMFFSRCIVSQFENAHTEMCRLM